MSRDERKARRRRRSWGRALIVIGVTALYWLVCPAGPWWAFTGNMLILLSLILLIVALFRTVFAGWTWKATPGGNADLGVTNNDIAIHGP